MDRLTVQDPALLVLAAGDTASAVNNARGHLFEEFVVQLLHEYGYDPPTERDLNVTSDGIEIDAVVRHSFSGHTALIEAKAYSSPVRARVVTSFYGALGMHRFEDPDAHGYLFVIPRLVPEGEEQARRAREQDSKFHCLNSIDIVTRLRDRGIVSNPDVDAPHTSDPTVLITEEGIYAALKILDEETRRATAIIVWGARGAVVPQPVLNLLADHEYAAGLQLRDLNRTETAAEVAPAHSDAAPIVVPVQGSKADFDSFPASPKNFVGRKSYVNALRSIVERGHGVFVLNAQSGWGKSSLALKAKQLVDSIGGYGEVFDSRTASSPRYVAEVLRRSARAAEQSGLLRLPSDQSWASLPSAVASIEGAKWLHKAPLMVFFDQFENVFQQERTTREFRDLALHVRDSQVRILIGFAWKTDMVSWTENHPYRFRDEIRGSGEQLMVGPMGPRDVEQLLRRLEKQLPDKLSRDLRQRLREYSQGLPWLFKKLAGHVINEIGEGRSQEQLVSEALNVRSLFEADMAGLNPVETEALKHVARFAPISATEVTERYSAGVVQSLLDSRLAVAVGDKLDTYWDIFRDFLNTDRVPIEDGYIVRQNPASVSRLMSELMPAGGDEAVSDLARNLKTSEATIFNLSRELRLFGLIAYAPNRVRLLPEIVEADDPETVIRGRVEASLRRHRAYSLLTRLAERFSAGIPLSVFAEELQHAFPSVEARPQTWSMYARAFAFWFEYAGLAEVSGSKIHIADESFQGKGQLLGPPPVRVRVDAIYVSPGPPLALLNRILSERVNARDLGRRERRLLYVLTHMRLVQMDRAGVISAVNVDKDGPSPQRIREALEIMPGLTDALKELEGNPSASASALGHVIQVATGADWTQSTGALVGKQIRSWARKAGVKVIR